jgi:hypothetical protein
MAIDPNWVRENPEEAARQIELLTKERDQYRAAEEAQVALRQKTQARVESSVPKWRFESLVEQCRITEEQRDEARRRLALLNEDGAWHWMNDGNDHLESLSCLVLINAAELRSLIAEKQADALGALAERKDQEADSEESFGLKSKCAYAAVCAANESNRLRRIAQGGA